MTTELSFVIRHAELSYNQFDDEVIVIHLGSGKYFSLRGSAAAIWNRLQEGPASAASLAQAFVGDVAPDIVVYLQELAELDLLTPSSEPPIALPADLAQTPFTPPAVETFDDLQGLLLADPIHEVSDEGWPAPADDMPRAA